MSQTQSSNKISAACATCDTKEDFVKLENDDWQCVECGEIRRVELEDKNRENTKTFPTVAVAEDKKSRLRGLGAKPEGLEIEQVKHEPGETTDNSKATEGDESESDGNTTKDTTQENNDSTDSTDAPEQPEFVGRDDPDEEPDEVIDTHDEIHERNLAKAEQHTAIESYDDPIPNLPGWMKEEVKEHGSMDLNKDGCQVIANALDFEVSAAADVKAHETDFEYACYTATVTRPDGRTFTAVGDCHIEEPHKDKKDLNRMAETRAKKRSVKWATAGGIEPFISGGQKKQ